MAEPSASRRAGKGRSSLPVLTRFDVLRAIGEGGAGLVFEAIDRERNARVALKMLRVLDGEMLFRLKEEFRALQDLEHPNLIRLFELVSDEGIWFFTMELIDGTNFVAHVSGRPEPQLRVPAEATDAPTEPAMSGSRRAVAAARQPAADVRAEWLVDEAKLRAALGQLARGLVALHATGKVHRDIKPSNVLVSREGRVVILDFGLVHDTAEAGPTDSDLIVGTISHMAPEQAAGEELGPAADWYSVGVVLYQCLTGRQPFDGRGADVLERKQNEDPPRPRDVVAGIPDDLDALCMDLLARNPSARPRGGEVVSRLESRPLSDRPGRTIQPVGRSPFVGRGAEMAVLAEGLASASKPGAGAVTIVVEGESGVGKSALVRRFTKGLQRRDADHPREGEDGEATPGALVLAGRCYEREDVPYKAIDGVIDALSVHLAALSRNDIDRVMPPTGFVLAYAFPVLRRLAGMEIGPTFRLVGLQESRSLLFHALRELFANLAAERPLVLVIDDLQWADADSLAALTEILRPPSPPIFLLATARAPNEPRIDPDAAPFDLPGDVRTLPLTRLSQEEGLELVGLLAENISPSVRQRIADEAGGHPLFVDELVRHAEFLGGHAPANVHLDDAILARVARLDARARAVLELVAVSGVALPQETAMRAAGLAFGDFSTHLQTLRSAHLARTHGRRGEDAIEAYHDRVREAVSAHLSADARRQCHSLLAHSLEAAATKDADALSVHWLGAGDEAKAGAYARIAAEQARAALAFESAARLFGRALMLGLRAGSLEGAALQELRITLGETLANAGRGREAAQAYFEAARAAAPDEALDLRRRAAEELLTSGLLEEGDAALRSVLAAVGMSLPRTPLVALVALLFYRFLLHVRGSGFVERDEREIAPHALTRVDAFNGVGRSLALIDTIRAAYFQARALLDALRLGEPKRIAHALAAEAVYYATNGNAARSAKLLAQARPIAKRAGAVREEALIETSTGFSAFVLGRFLEGLAHSDRGAEMLRQNCPGAFWERRTAQLASIWAVGWMGDLNALAVRVEHGLREAEQRGDIYSRTTLRSGVPNLTWLRRGDASAARALVLDAIRQWTQRGYHSQHYWSLLALTRIELYEGDARAAYARVEREWPRLTRALILQVRLMRVEALHLHASAALAVAAEEGARTSEQARMLAIAERDARAISAMGWALAAPHAQMIRAGAAALRRDEARAVAELEVAARGFDAVAMGLHATSAQWHLGHLRGGSEGRALVTSAEAWMKDQGVASASQLAATIAPGLRR